MDFVSLGPIFIKGRRQYMKYWIGCMAWTNKEGHCNIQKNKLLLKSICT
jgi:hypothetical protein